MNQMVLYLAGILAVFLIGMPLVFAQEKIENGISKSMLLGTSILVIAAYWSSVILKGGFQNKAFFIYIGILIAFWIYAFRNRVNVISNIKKLSKQDAFLTLICIVGGVLPLLLYLRYGAVYPYCDGYTYLCNADYLLEHGYLVNVNPDELILHPWLSQTYLYQINHFRIGAQMLLGFLTSLFGMDMSVFLFLPLSGMSVALCGFGAWSYFSASIPVDWKSKALGILMVVFNGSVIAWCALYGFLPQIMGSALFIGCVGSFLNISNWNYKKIMYTVFLVSAFPLTYNEMLPFFVGVVVCIVVMEMWEQKSMKDILIRTVLVALGAIGLIINYIPGMIQALLLQMGAVVGWNQNLSLLDYIAYFLSTVPISYNYSQNAVSLKSLIYLSLTVVMFVLLMIGLIKCEKKVHKKMFAISIPYIGMFLYFLLFTQNPFTGGTVNTWSIYKLFQYFFVAVGPFIGVMIAKGLNNKREKIAVVFLIFMCVNTFSVIKYCGTLAEVGNSFTNSRASLNEYIKLKEYVETALDGENKRIALYNVPVKHRQMITYFLKDYELVSDWNSDDYMPTIPDVPQDYYYDALQFYYDPSDKSGCAGMIEKKYYFIFMNGFYDENKLEDTYWRWAKHKSSLSVSYHEEKSGVFCVNVRMSDYYKDVELNVYNNGRFVDSISLMSDLEQSVRVPLDFGDNNIEFISTSKDDEFDENSDEQVVLFVNYAVQEIQ